MLALLQEQMNNMLQAGRRFFSNLGLSRAVGGGGAAVESRTVVAVEKSVVAVEKSVPSNEASPSEIEFIAAVCSANLEKVKSILASIKNPASRARLCQVQAINDEDGERVPLLKLAAQRRFKIIACCLLHNGAIQNILELYADNAGQFEANVRTAGWKCA
jgi:hypothetical protein